MRDSRQAAEPTVAVRTVRTVRTVRSDSAPTLWILAALADLCSADDRAAFAERAAGEIDERTDRLLLLTCHRAELIGSGPLPDPAERAGLAGAPHLASRLRLVAGDDAVRHVLRLAAGLESAVVGEDQVLHQVRELRDAARERRRLDPHLSRLLEMALGVGRRARAARGGRKRDAGDRKAVEGTTDPVRDAGAESTAAAAPGDRDTLAGRAVDWLALQAGDLAGRRLLVVGAGEMGLLVAHEARARGADVVIASRTADRLREGRGPSAHVAMDLAEAAAAARSVEAIAVALAGRWHEADGLEGLPPTVDLSSPPSLAPGRSPHQLDIDGLFRVATASSADLAARRYARSAEPLVEEAVERYRRWSAGRASVDALRRVRDAAEQSRRDGLARLLRRLPDLDARERGLVEEFSQQLVAAILHEPTVRLREDVDGSAADAARALFGL